MATDQSAERVIAATRCWLQQAVLGLNLCPFAAQPWREGRVRIVCSEAADADALLSDLQQELELLRDSDPASIETTLLVLPRMLADFLDFNDFQELAEALLRALELEGEIQVASFHPRFCFGDAAEDDPANATNRSPWPTLHLLREASIEQAVARLEDPDAIYRRNIDSLRQLGADGWARLARSWEDPQ